MKRQLAMKAAVLLLALCMLSGCSAQIEEREMADLSGVEIDAGVSAPETDGADETKMLATLFFLSEDASELVPVTREICVKAGENRAEAALDALLAGPAETDTGVFWPDLGAGRSERFMEISGGVATVDLPAYTRTLSQETLFAVRMAISLTLTEFSQISYVNVLVGGREEGLDLGATLPVGTFSRINDLAARDRYNRLYDQRQNDEGVTLLTTMYFPSADGAMILPEVRSVRYAQVAPIEYLYTLLGEIGKGSNNALSCAAVPAPMDFIEEMPEIIRTEDGYVAIELRLDGSLDRALKDAGLTRGIYMAMLTDTLMGFVPGVEGLRVTIDSLPVSMLYQEETPDGRSIVFAQALAMRSDFVGYVGAPARLYTMKDDGLERVLHILPQERADDPRTRLLGLMDISQEEERFSLPQGLQESDILAVHVGGDAIAVNLSGNFARAVSSLSHRYERAAIYAMVNTLTEDMDVQRVVFFFDGEQRQSLAGGLEMRGAFTRNPGMVVN